MAATGTEPGDARRLRERDGPSLCRVSGAANLCRVIRPATNRQLISAETGWSGDHVATPDSLQIGDLC